MEEVRNYVVGERVNHEVYGGGVVTNVEERKEKVFTFPDIVTVKFDKARKDVFGVYEEIVDTRNFTHDSLDAHDLNRHDILDLEARDIRG